MPRAIGSHPDIDFDAIRRDSYSLRTLAASLPPETVQAFADEVVQRLSAGLKAAGQTTEQAVAERVEQLCAALLAKDPDPAPRMIAELRGEGITAADLYVIYLAAAARRLGTMWEADEASFLDVSIGTSRILAIMRSLRPAFRPNRIVETRDLVFAVVPDEQHTIGITMAADLFRREGWEIELIVGAEHDEVVDRIARSESLVVGLTAHGRQSLPQLVRLVLAIRIVKPGAYVLISGNVVAESEDILKVTGADGFATDVTGALAEVKRLHDLALA